ncbi:hypothetical protein Q7P37_004329 [Cladosporium fusiforme]
MLRLLVAALLASSAVASAIPEAEARRSRADDRKTIYVRKNEIISDVIRKAPSGSRIVVTPGVYKQSVTINKDGITLVGTGVTLQPPDEFETNPCTGFAGPLPDNSQTQAGICVAGSDIRADAFVAEHQKVRSVGRPVKDVTVTGFTVEGFVGFNILVVGGQNTKVYGNTVRNNPVYGILTAGSKDTEISGNVVTITSTESPFNFVGICMDNLSKVKVTKNKISNYFIGLCVQTNGAEVEENEVSSTCYGAFLDPFVKDVRLRKNHFYHANEACTGFPIAGIILDGSINARVENNLVEDWNNGDPKTAGIAVVDDPCNDPNAPSLSCIVNGGGTAVAKGNLVKGNKLRGNDLDIRVDTQGRGNVVEIDGDGGVETVHFDQNGRDLLGRWTV